MGSIPITRSSSSYGRLAQLVEQLTLNQRVQGSSPWSPTRRNTAPSTEGVVFCLVCLLARTLATARAKRSRAALARIHRGQIGTAQARCAQAHCTFESLVAHQNIRPLPQGRGFMFCRLSWREPSLQSGRNTHELRKQGYTAIKKERRRHGGRKAIAPSSPWSPTRQNPRNHIVPRVFHVLYGWLMLLRHLFEQVTVALSLTFPQQSVTVAEHSITPPLSSLSVTRWLRRPGRGCVAS